MKHHIVGIVGQVEACPKASDEDKKRVKAYLENSKNKKRERLEELNEERAGVNIGVDGEDDDCQVVGNSSRKKSKDLGPIDKWTSAIDPTKARQQNINDALKLKFTNDVHEYVARWIYEAGIPFHAIDNQSFRQLVEAVGQFGPGYKPPSQYLLREPLLKQEVERTKLSLKKHEEEWMKNGCSIMTDAWTDRKRRSIMNICVNCKLGTSFLGSIEESMEAHTGVYIFEFVEKYIIEIGPQNVVQVVTDNATNNMAAADLLKVTQPQIFWTSCATHTINLMLEAIGKLPKFSGMLEKAKALTIFIYAHHRTLAIMRKYTKKKDIVRPGVTRFATSFLTLESLKDKKDQLRLMFTSEEWSKTKLRSSVKGKVAEATVTSISFWNGVSLALNVFTPLVKVLRLVDGDKKPSMVFLLGALKQAKEDIRKSFKKEENATPILKIIDEKSKGRLDSPLHYAAYLLNPVFYFKDSSISNDTNVINEFLNCVEIIFPTDEDMQSTIANDELLKYKSKSGNFGRKMAVTAYEKVDVYHDFDPEEVPENWMEAPDILSLRSLDRKFVFPGEQIRILICLSACKQDTEIITPFKVAAVMNKNWIGKGNNKQNGDIEGPEDPVTQRVDMSAGGLHDQNGMEGVESQKDVPTGESLLRMEDYRGQTKQLLQNFKSSHFFARIAESYEPLWTKRRVQKAKLATSETFEKKLSGDSLETEKIMKMKSSTNAAIDRGKFDARTSGGLVRDAAKCCSLPNGDIVVLLHVNISVDFVRDPILEILQFEMYREKNSIMENMHAPASERLETSGDLLKWLLPVDNSSLPPARAVSPPLLSSSSSIRNTPTKPTVSGSSGSQLFSFGNFRSYSMSSLPQNSAPPPSSVTTPNSKPSFEPEDWNQFSFRKFVESGKSGNEGLLSFRGLPLEPERFSVRCGLEGTFTPGRRWRKNIEIIQPVEINSVSVECNTDDLLCVHVKNVSPEYASDIVVFIDAITIIFEETSADGPPLNLPITCIEAGNDFRLPNLALRRGEEHSFILKPATSLWKGPKGNSGSNLQPSCLPVGSAASSWLNYSIAEGKHSASSADQYAILVSCRSNYTESKLFFKQTTSWRPRISRDLMISVASEMSNQTLGSDGTQLPVQVIYEYKQPISSILNF